MAALLDNVGFTVGNTPGTGVINVGTVLTDATNGDYQLPATAGAANGTVYNWRAIDTGGAWMNFTATYSTTGPSLTGVTLVKSSTGSQLSLTSAAKIFGVIFGQNGNDFNINSADDFTITSGNSKLTVSNNNGSKLTYFGTSGWFAGANTSAVGPGGQSVFMSSAGYFGLNCALTWGSLASSPDVYLQRDAAAILALKNSTVSQTFRLYGTYTGSADAWAEFNHSTSGNLTISTQKNGTGAAGSINLVPGSGLTRFGLPNGTLSNYASIAASHTNTVGGVALDLAASAAYAPNEYTLSFTFANSGRFTATRYSLIGTDDIFFQALPPTNAGFGYMESWNGAGMVLGTGASTLSAAGPVIIRPGRGESVRFPYGGGMLIGNNTGDTGLARNAAGVIEINNGTAGTWRDLKLRTAFHVAGTTAQAQINLASGVAPTSPADGDIWYDGAGLKLRTGGSTVAIGGATSTPDPYTLSSQYGGL